MHAHKDDLPVKIDAPGAKARVLPDFGDASAYRAISGEYFSLAAGADIAPLLEGLTDDLCDAPHWGFLLEGALTVTYATGEEETITGGELFYWPPGHSIRVGVRCGGTVLRTWLGRNTPGVPVRPRAAVNTGGIAASGAILSASAVLRGTGGRAFGGTAHRLGSGRIGL